VGGLFLCENGKYSWFSRGKTNIFGGHPEFCPKRINVYQMLKKKKLYRVAEKKTAIYTVLVNTDKQ